MNKLLLKVIDNGQDLNENVRSGFGIGMSNTKARLDAMFNSDYSVTIDENFNHGTTVSITIPFETKNHSR